MTRPKKKDLKQTVEREIALMMSSGGEPSEGRMKLLKLAIGFLAVNAKLEESEYGGFFGNDEASGVQKQSRKEPAARQTAGGSSGDSGDDEPGGAFFTETTGKLPN